MLVAVPLRDQLDEPTADHQPDENASANCVPASLSAALTALTGQTYDGDQLKDAVYGQGYTGATDPGRFIDYAAQQGVRMWEGRGSGDQLVAIIAAELARGHPVYGAIPSFWGNTTAADIAAHGGPTHAVMFCDASPAAGTLTAMNPWPVDGHNAFYQTMSAAWWASRLVYGHVYPLERAMLQITDVAAYFAALDDNHWKCQQTGCIVGMGLLEAYRSWPAAGGLNGFTTLGLPLSNEAFPQAGVGVQRFERGALVWDPDRQLDNPPGAVGPVYLAHLDSGPAQDPRVPSLQSQLAASTANVDALSQQVKTLQAQLAQAQHGSTSDTAASAAIHALAAALASATAA